MRRHLEQYFHHTHWNEILQTILSWSPVIIGILSLALSLYIAVHSFKKEKYFHKQKIVEEIVHTLFKIDLHVENLIAHAKGFYKAKKENKILLRDENFLSSQYLQEQNNNIIKSVALIQLYFPKIHTQWDMLQDVVDKNSNFLNQLIQNSENMDLEDTKKIIDKMNNEFERLWKGFLLKMTSELQKELSKEEPRNIIF